MTILVRSGSVAASRRYALELVRPSSIAFAGGGSETADIVGLGSVDFSAVTSLSLNGVFSAEYDNYMITLRHVGSTDLAIRMRLRDTGTDATGNNYNVQYLQADSTSVGAGRTTNFNLYDFSTSSATQRSGDTVYIYGPYLAQPTAHRAVTCRGTSSAQIYDVACTHSLSTSYDGFTIFPNTGTLSGMITVYGLRG